ncbi:LuxR C-terminal-related transcriptional regulator [Streptomyces sp. CAU 1734]|uniref:LuxR C-terminal-related transcriptional regulator n=1 Tax=Streptomyces sp. CAU 1734 TaxID=3140360 RepID=UPI0032608A76
MPARRSHHESGLQTTLLSDTERSVLEHRAQGRTKAETAAALGIAESTVSGHVSRAAGKLVTSGAPATLNAAYRTGQITLPDAVTGMEFSDDERRLWQEAATRNTNIEIARALKLDPGQVGSALRDLMRRTGARDRVHLVMLAYAHRILHPDFGSGSGAA